MSSSIGNEYPRPATGYDAQVERWARFEQSDPQFDLHFEQMSSAQSDGRHRGPL